MLTVNKTELASSLAQKKGYKKYAIKNAIDDIFDEILTSLEQENKVTIRGFGTFEVKTYKSHAAVHPETKERFIVPSYKNVAFRPGDELTRAIRKK